MPGISRAIRSISTAGRTSWREVGGSDLLLFAFVSLRQPSGTTNGPRADIKQTEAWDESRGRQRLLQQAKGSRCSLQATRRPPATFGCLVAAVRRQINASCTTAQVGYLVSSQKPDFRPSPAARTSGKRFAFALVSWLLAAPGVLLFLMTAGAALVAGDTSVMRALMLASLLVWSALAVMTVSWLQNRRCHWLWPVFGAVVGTPSAIASAQMLTFIPAVPLAVYLVYWHLSPARQGASAD